MEKKHHKNMKFVTSRINKKTPYGAMSVCLLSREKLLKDFSVYKTVFVRDHSSITSAKRWVDGVRKWQFLLIYSTIYDDVGGWVSLKKPKTC